MNRAKVCSRARRWLRVETELANRHFGGPPSYSLLKNAIGAIFVAQSAGR
jgi:hypothetical protein